MNASVSTHILVFQKAILLFPMRVSVAPLQLLRCCLCPVSSSVPWFPDERDARLPLQVLLDRSLATFWMLQLALMLDAVMTRVLVLILNSEGSFRLPVQAQVNLGAK